MKRFAMSVWVGCLTMSVLVGCQSGGAASGLVVVPPDMEKAVVPDGKYQNVHAVYLYNIGYLHYDPQDIGHSQYPTYVFSEFARIKLLTRAATEFHKFGNIRFRHIGDLRDIQAYVEKPDGTRKTLTKNDFVTNVIIKDIIPAANREINLNETTIIFPGLEPGDIIGYGYTAQFRRSLTWQFSKMDAPVLFSKFMVARPMRRIEIQPLIYDRHNLEPEHAEEKGMAAGMWGRVGSRQATYDIWTVHDVPPIVSEPAMPPMVDLASRIRVWQGERRLPWSELGETYYKWFTFYGRVPDRARELAGQVIAGVEQPRDRARAIHDWVKQNLNIQDHDQLSFVPRQVEIDTIDVAKLVREKNATPEQAAALMWAMMSAAGVEASLVLSTAKNDPPAEEGLPDLYQFAYPLLGLADGTLIDTTSRFCPFGQLPYWFEGRKSLWVKGSTVAFKDLPESLPAANVSQLAVRGSLDPEGNAQVEVTRELTGQLALGMRQYLGPMGEKDREKVLLQWVTQAADKAELGEFAVVDMEDATKPLKLVYQFKVPNYAQVMNDQQLVKLGAFVHLTRCPELLSEKRSNKVWFAHKWQEQMGIQIALPPGFSLQALPKGFRTREIDQGTAMGVRTSYGSPDGKSLNVIRTLSVNETLVDAGAGYANLRSLIQRYLAQKDTLITLKLPKLD